MIIFASASTFSQWIEEKIVTHTADLKAIFTKPFNDAIDYFSILQVLIFKPIIMVA